ncbi:hypothetical protein ACFWSF_39760 [Streptomyces sp. NPDC058611]|uniref:hypothetical protein n=1 Tax=unclassified Streptomyces TaxID=2593676 RepID=UPI003653C2AC
MERFSLCSIRLFSVLVWDTDGTELGTMDVTAAQEINTVATSRHFLEEFYFRVDRMSPGVAGAGVTVAANTTCNYLSGCSDNGQDPWVGAMPLPPVGTWVEGTVERSWTGANRDDSIFMLWSLTFTKANGKSSTVEWGGIDYEVRCDDQISSWAGCVIRSFRPTLVIDGTQLPAARDYIARVQATLSSHPGWAGKGEPLHREADSEIQRQNRLKVCDNTWIKEDRFGGKVTPHADSIECDEWPFAATKESGGQQGIQSGTECQQWTIWSGGVGVGWPAKNYAVHAYGARSGTAQCARASMPRSDNGGAGTALSNFYQNQRVLGGEAFWVDAGAATVLGDPGPTKPVSRAMCNLKSPSVSGIVRKAAPENTFLDYARTTPDGWTGGDSTYSVKLPNGRNLWMFSDTFLGPLNPDGTRPTSARLINSSFVLQDGPNLSTIHGGTAVAPQALVPPVSDGWYWLGDGKITQRAGNNHLQVIFQQYHRYGPGGWDWGWKRSVLATFSLSDLSKPQSIVPIPSAAGITWGSGILPSTDSGDGYTYIYGVADAPVRKSMRIARVHGSDLDSRWEFLDPANSRWVLDERQTSNALTGISNEYSVTPWNGSFLLLTQDSNEAFSAKVYAYTSCDPSGTFKNPVEVFRMPETSLFGTYQDMNVYAYNAHMHGALTRDGGNTFTFSYNVNSMDNSIAPGGAHYRDPSIYKPRWVSFTATPAP